MKQSNPGSLMASLEAAIVTPKPKAKAVHKPLAIYPEHVQKLQDETNEKAKATAEVKKLAAKSA